MRIEIRSDSVVLAGYINVTARESRILPSPTGRFVEEILPKTFERALSSGQNVDLLFNHDRNRKLGSTQEGNLELREDNIGLFGTAIITDEQVMEKAKSGELRGWSFGFQNIRDSWKDREDGLKKRSVEELRLLEVSILDRTPAYSGTSIEARDEEEILNETRVIEDSSEIINSAVINKTENSTETKKQEERNVPEAYYYEHLQLEKTLLELGGLR